MIKEYWMNVYIREWEGKDFPYLEDTGHLTEREAILEYIAMRECDWEDDYLHTIHVMHNEAAVYDIKPIACMQWMADNGFKDHGRGWEDEDGRKESEW